MEITTRFTPEADDDEMELSHHYDRAPLSPKADGKQVTRLLRR